MCFLIRIRIGSHKHEHDDQFMRFWEIEHCHGPTETYEYRDKDGFIELKTEQYQAEHLYIHRCCLAPGIYNLICRNTKNLYGWGNASIEILGQRFCDDFVGNKVVRNVAIRSKFMPKSFLLDLH